MATNKTYSDRLSEGYFLSATTNGVQAISNITKRLKKQIATLSGEFVKRVAETFVERARQKLIDTNYNETEHYAKNIVVKKYSYNNYRVGIEQNSEKPIMYFLEFGTGLVGKEGSEDFVNLVEGKTLKEFAEGIGWQYAVNEENYFSPIPDNPTAKPYGEQNINGWIYYDEKKGRKRFTSGLYPVAYLYDTINEIPEIIQKVKKELKIV